MKIINPPITFLKVKHGLDPSRVIDTLKFKADFNKKNPNYFKPSGSLVFCGDQGDGKTLSGVSYITNLLKEYPYCILCTNTEILGYPPNARLNKIVRKSSEWVEEYKKVEEERRLKWYDDKIDQLKEHWSYTNKRIPVDEYVASYIVLYPFNRRTDFENWKAENEWELISLLDGSRITEETILAGIHSRVCVEYWGLDTLKFIHNGKLGVVYFIDEIHLELNSLESKNIDMSIITEISQQRKQRKHIVGTSQRYNRLAKPLREQVQYCVDCRNFFALLQYNKLISNKQSYEKDGQLMYKTSKRLIWFHHPSMYLLYDTFVKMKRYNNEWQGRERDPFFDKEVSYNGSTRNLA